MCINSKRFIYILKLVLFLTEKSGQTHEIDSVLLQCWSTTYNNTSPALKQHQVSTFSAGTIFIHQNVKSVDARKNKNISTGC